MKFTTEDMNDIAWIKNPDNYEAGEVVRRLMNAGKWDEFLEVYANEDGEINCDELYDYLRFEAGEALQDVGLHETEATATVAEVAQAWEMENAPMRVKYSDKDGKPCASIYGDDLSLDIVDEDGEEDEITLDPDEVFELMRDKHHGNANRGAWDCEDPEAAVFEMWRGRR